MSKQAENSKRQAAGLASTTRGRSRVFKSAKHYDRKVGKKVGD